MGYSVLGIWLIGSLFDFSYSSPFLRFWVYIICLEIIDQNCGLLILGFWVVYNLSVCYISLRKMKGKVGLPGNYFVLNTGDKIPAIGLGTWQSGGDLCVQAVKTALSVGYRHIDCAHLYGNEVEVGEALAEAFKGSLKREDVFLTSKLYCTMNSLNKIENYVRVSLKNLGVSYLDLYLMHWPDSSAFGDATDPPLKSGSEYRQFLNRLKKAWKAMEGLVELGLVRAIGVSNFSVEQIKQLLKFAKIVPAVNQVGFGKLLFQF